MLAMMTTTGTVVRVNKIAVFVASALLAGPLVAVAPIGLAAPTALAAPATTSAYQALPEATTLLDTVTAATPLAAGESRTVVVEGEAPLPPVDGTLAVVLNVTVRAGSGVGDWSVVPSGSAPSSTPQIRIDGKAASYGPALSVANLVTVAVNTDPGRGTVGAVDIRSTGGGHVVVDLVGAYVASGATTAGRLAPLAAPTRILSTTAGPALAAGKVRTVTVPGGAGALAAVVNLTTIASAAGRWSAYSTALAAPPSTASLRSMHTWHIVANQAIVPLDGSGAFNIHSEGGGHVIVDLAALVTGPGAPESTDGLFVPLAAATRVLDTPTFALPGWTLEVPVAQQPTIARPDVAAVALHVTAKETLSPGYVTVGPAGSDNTAVAARGTSTLNVLVPAQSLSNHVVVASTARGVALFNQGGAKLALDIVGYYLGTPAPTPFAAPINGNPTPARCVGFPAWPIAAVGPGARGETVRRVQQRLLDLGFWNAGADGGYGHTTSQAVMAFQKWTSLPRTGAVDDTTAARLNTHLCRPTTTQAGDLFEVDKGRQLGFIVRGGKVVWAINVSTGTGKSYREWSPKTKRWETGTSITPNGTWRVYFERPTGWWEGDLGRIYRPKYFRGGVAVHGSSSIPGYPASHGCVRVSTSAMDMIWTTNAMPRNSRVVVHD
jgi:lipoprotein-anchoring transpeptidase ErfK/SrfK